MTKTMKLVTVATAIAGLLVGSITGVFAQEPANPDHPRGSTSGDAPAPRAQPAAPEEDAAPAEGTGKMMGCEMMKKMQQMHGKMMGGGMMMQPKGDTGPSSQALNGVTGKMQQDIAITFTGNADVDFVKIMIPHHQAAVDMAKVVLAFGKDPEINKLAEGVVKAEEAEITSMQEWLKKQGQ